MNQPCEYLGEKHSEPQLVLRVPVGNELGLCWDQKTLALSKQEGEW